MNATDDLFARVIRHNKLMGAEAIDSAIAEYEGKGETTGSLSQFLVDSKMISEEVRGAVDQALAKQRPAQSDAKEFAPPGASRIQAAVTGATPEPEVDSATQIRQKRAWKPRSKRMTDKMLNRGKTVTSKGPAAESTGTGAAQEVNLDEFIRRHVPSRSHQRFLQYCIERKVDVFSEQDATRMISVPPGTARTICNDWLKRGIIKLMGEGTYNFAPSPKLRTEIAAFFEAWKDSAQHSDLVRKIIQHERSS